MKIKRIFFWFFLLSLFSEISFSQGSGNVLSFNGTSRYIDLGITAGAGVRTIEIWFKPAVNITSSITDAISLITRDFNNGDATNTNEFGFSFTPGWGGFTPGTLLFFRRVGSTSYVIQSNSTYWQAGAWFHVTGVIDPVSGMKMYVDGVLQNDTDPSTQPVQNQTGFVTDMVAIGTWGYWGGVTSHSRFFNGDIDEVRFWTTARTQTQVRDKMCSKLQGNEPGLRAYYRFDNTSGGSLSDVTGNGYNGILNGFPISPWHYSSAPIGDTSTYVYPASFTGVTLNLQYQAGDNFIVSNVSTSPAGAHIYRVNTLPNSIGGITSNTQADYYGVFLTGVIGNYDINYDYSYLGNCGVGCKKLFSRTHNAIMNWTQLNPIISNCAFTKTNESPLGTSYRAEYIISDSIFNASVLGNDTTLCNGSTYSLNATLSGASTYDWNNGDTTTSIAASSAGIYWVDITLNGCTERDSVTLTFTPGSNIFIGNDTVLCNVSSYTLNAIASGNPPVTWSTGQQADSITISAGGIYSAIASLNGCTSSDTINVQMNSSPNVNIGNDTSLCSGNSFFINAATPSATYNWNTGATSPGISVATPGTYWVDVTVNGCDEQDSITIQFNPSPTLFIGNDTTICSAVSSYTINTVTNTFPVVWSTGAQGNSLAISTGGLYFASVTNSFGCSAYDTTNIVLSTFPQVSFTATDSSGCSPLCVTFTNTSQPSSASCLWNFGNGITNTSQIITHCFNAGNYSTTLTVTNNAGCSSVSSPYSVNVFPQPVAAFDPSTTNTDISQPQIDFTDNSVNATTWSWNFGDPLNSSSVIQNPSFTYQDAGCFDVQLIVSGAMGCKDTATEKICISDLIAIYLPNTFTPNGNGLNDYFYPVGTGIDWSTLDFWIWDRWGQLIFESHDINKQWDGRVKNGKEIAEMDVYVWELEVTDNAGTFHRLNGHVTLVK